MTGAAILLAACSAPQKNAAPDAVQAETQTPDGIALNPVRNAYFGDVHVHTGNSFDAYVFGVRRTP